MRIQMDNKRRKNEMLEIVWEQNPNQITTKQKHSKIIPKYKIHLVKPVICRSAAYVFGNKCQSKHANCAREWKEFYLLFL